MSIDRSTADLLIPLDVEPRDARESDDAVSRADTVVYRLGLRAQPVLNLPDHLDVGGVQVDFVRGPVLAQRTEMRQRPGHLPITFDKHMARVLVGDGELLAILSISEDSVPEQPEAALLLWRQRTEAAAGVLASVLDERVVGARVFEDAVLLSDGETIGAMDWQERVRSFLPMEVTALDRPALDHLATINLGDGSAVARASRLYRRAAAEGPTADAYVLLYVAMESLLESTQPSKRELDALLATAGIDPDGLPQHTGLLIRLRGQIVHEGLEDHERLRVAFYELEAIVRTLIRQVAELRGGWWPTLDIAAYATPWPERLDAVGGPPQAVWHSDRLPPAPAPAAERLPRNVLVPDRSLLVTMTRALETAAGDASDLLLNLAVDARMQLLPDEDVTLALDITPGDGVDIDPTRIAIGDRRLQGLEHPARFAGLTVDFVGALGHWYAAQTIGNVTNDDLALRSAIASWYQYDRLVNDGELDPGLLSLPAPDDTEGLGTLGGWAGAGDGRSSAALDTLDGRTGELGRAIRDALRESPPAPSRPKLDWSPATDS
jgi:hypothetical protein